MAIIGAGAIGTSTAYHLAEKGLEVAVIEKESGPAMHQSGRNSGVIHAGYNPKPGTAKAEYCVRGNKELREYCLERGVPVREGGILIVGHNDADMAVIAELDRRGKANGTTVEVIDEQGIKSLEPYALGIGALLASDGASFDSRGYVQALASDAKRAGTKFLFSTKVDSINEHSQDVEISTNKGTVSASVAINASGLFADQLAGEIAPDMRVVPFRGYYAELVPNKTHTVNSHVYATPDLDFPFLGVHLSKRTDGRVIVGPGAMLAFGREAYRFGSFKGGGLGRILEWPGFYRMFRRPEFQNLLRQEIKKSIMIKAIGREAMQLVSGLSENDFARSYAGNRAQLVDAYGNLVDDIVVRETPRCVHVLNTVSPGLTCSMPFGRDLSERARQKL